LFKSSFLNQNLENGNIYRVPNSLFIRFKIETDIQEDNAEDRRKRLNKIASELKKDGYIYDPCRDAYVKCVTINDVELQQQNMKG